MLNILTLIYVYGGKNRMHSQIFRSENGLYDCLSPLAVFLAFQFSRAFSFLPFLSGNVYLVTEMNPVCLFVCFLAAIQSTAQVLGHQLEDEVTIEFKISINPLFNINI